MPRNLTEAQNYGDINSQQVQMLLEAWDVNIRAAQKAYHIDDRRARNLAIMLENTKRELNRLNYESGARLMEQTQPSDVGPFVRFAFDIITAVMPNLIAEDLVSVQPMAQKLAQIFFLKYKFGSDKGPVRNGDLISDGRIITPIGNPARYYSASIVNDEIMALNLTDLYEGNFDFTPMLPGTLLVTIDGQTIEDDGNGLFRLSAGSTVPFVSGTVDYRSGAYKIQLSTAPTMDGPTITYQYDNESVPIQLPEVRLEVEEVPVRAHSRKLLATYAFDAAYDLKMSQGIDMDDELLNMATSEIKHEIDMEIIANLYRQAALVSTWDGTFTPGGAYISQSDFRASFLDELISARNQTFQVTRRSVANWLIVGKKAGDILESLGQPRYQPVAATDVVGPHLAGTLDGALKVYKNPYFDEYAYLLGYKGSNFMDAGYAYCPYLPIFATSILMDEFKSKRGFATSYGVKMLNPNLYVKGQIVMRP